MGMSIGARLGSMLSQADKVNLVRTGHESELSNSELKGLKRTGAVQCSTCASRQYQDGSNEQVSFKSAAHVSPQASVGRVKAHEGEHVANAYNDAAQNNGKVLRASVSIHMAICPECGRSYSSGGTTTTSIKYNEDNPYGKNQKSAEKEAMTGNNIDFKV